MVNYAVCNSHYQNPLNKSDRYYIEHVTGRHFNATKTTEASASFTVVLTKQNNIIGFHAYNSNIFIPLRWIERKSA